MDALAFIEKNGKTRRQPYYVLSGDEDFLGKDSIVASNGLLHDEMLRALGARGYDPRELQCAR